MSQYNNCPNCFMPSSGGPFCGYCGYDRVHEKRYRGALPHFTVLHNRYLVGRVLGRGGFGITYIARDISNNTNCAIKEYLPSEYAERGENTKTVYPLDQGKSSRVFNHGKEKYIEEGNTLQTLKSNPMVVNVKDLFYENNTAYLVMEYLDGMDLRRKAKLSGGKLDADFMKNIFVTVASALMEIHTHGILHRDLSPENIFVLKNGAVKLIDFGASRNYIIAKRQEEGMSILVKPGFAPPEQYVKDEKQQGAWSDVYALCATFYSLVSGKAMVDALYRQRGIELPSLISLGCHVSPRTSAVIEKGLALDYRKRYKDFGELLKDIDIPLQPKPQPSSKPPVQPKPPVRPKPPITEITEKTKPTTESPTSVLPQNGKFKVTISSVANGYQKYNSKTFSYDIMYNIGRGERCSYVISGDTNVSRNHCYIQMKNNGVYLVDLSRNGTYLMNGSRLAKNKEYKIKSGAKFYLATAKHTMTVEF